MQFGQQGGWLGVWVQSPERQLSEPGSPSITRGQKHIRGHLLVRYFSKSPRFETCLSWRERSLVEDELLANSLSGLLEPL